MSPVRLPGSAALCRQQTLGSLEVTRTLIPAFLVVLSACRSVQQSPPQPLAATGSVRLSSLESDFFNNVAVFVGRYSLFADSVVVEFDSATVIRRDNYPNYPHPKQFDSISVGLAVPYYKGEYTWKIHRHSRAVPAPRVLRVGDRFSLAALRLVVPRQSSDNLSQTWLVAALHETVVTPGKDGYTGYASAYAHSQCDVFTSSASKPPCR